MFGVKEPIPGGLCLRVVYKFACAGSNACYVGETVRHFFHACEGAFSTPQLVLLEFKAAIHIEREQPSSVESTISPC